MQPDSIGTESDSEPAISPAISVNAETIARRVCVNLWMRLNLIKKS